MQFCGSSQQQGQQKSVRKYLNAYSHLGMAAAALIYPDFLLPSSTSVTLHRVATLSSVPVRPRTNPLAFPSGVHISEDRERLIGRLQFYDLVEREVQGDGNCQFRALSDQLYGSPDYHDEVRCAVLDRLKRFPAAYSPYVLSAYGAYLADMKKSGTWGDHVTLQAAADVYGMKIIVLSSFRESPVIAIEPAAARKDRILYLAFWAEVHYNSVYPGNEPPPPLPSSNHKMFGSKKLGAVLRHQLILS
ncbi:MAG: hypothetical protein WDW36_006358 [Sanguina aurantia]